MNSNRLPSDALTKRATPIRTALIAVASVVVVAGLSVGSVALGQTLGAHPTPTASALPADGPSPLSPAELAQIQQSAVDQQAQLAAQAAADKAAADAAAAQAAAEAAAKAAAQAAAAKKTSTAYAMGTAPKGAPVPFVKSSDPQNANGGDYIDPGLYCAAHSASTVNGVPVCD